MRHSLKVNKGLSLSQAQSISNLCYQRCVEIDNQIRVINNYAKKIGDVVIQKGNKIPDNITELLLEKSRLSACQAFLMENIKTKDNLLKEVKKSNVDLSNLTKPVKGVKMNINNDLISLVDEKYGWDQLSSSEYNEYLEAEAYAAHIGIFIHNDGKLSVLRNEIPNIPEVEWIEVETGKKNIVTIDVHHKSEDLMKIHESLAKLHRKYEQRVNYFKAKVKNIVTEKNAEIAKINNDLQIKAKQFNDNIETEYAKQLNEYSEKVSSLEKEFEIERQNKIKEISSMRIEVDTRFKDVVDMFLNDLE